MKNIIIALFLFTNVISAQNVSFNELDLIKSKSKPQIEAFLKKKNYSESNSQPKSSQWKSKDGNELIQFNGKGVLVILTYNQSLYKKMTVDLKKSKYKYLGKTLKNNIPVESYEKGKETIFLTSMKNPENSKQVYSITFI